MIYKETKTYKKLKNKEQDNYPQWLIVHHTGGTDANPKADTSNHTAVTVEKWHLKLGWEGLGYQFYINKKGEISRGRPELYHGAHTKTHNTKSIGICLAGNFDVTLPTEAQVKAIRELISDLMQRYNIFPSQIVPHRTYANKSCYGYNLPDDWARRLITDKPEPAKADEELIACQEEVEEQKSLVGGLLDFIINKLT